MTDANCYVFETCDELNSKIGQCLSETSRQNLTAFEVSDSFVIFATTTGLIYFLTRNNYTLHNVFRQLNKEVSVISLSRNEKLLTVISHSQSMITVIDLETNEKKYFRNAQISTITSITWSFSNEEFYFGNQFGFFSVIHMTNFFVKLLFQTPFITLFQLDSQIEQIDVKDHYYLISTRNHIYMYNDVSDKYWEVVKKHQGNSQINTVTSIGACFLKTNDDDLAICFAEDDRKLLIVNMDGTIIRTIDYYQNQLTSVFSEFLNNSNIFRLKNSTNFINRDRNEIFSKSKIYNFKSNFIVSRKSTGLFFTNVNKSISFFYNAFHNDVKYLKAIGNTVYVQTSSSVHTFQIDVIEKFLKNSICRKQYFLCLDYCLHFINQRTKEINDDILIVNIINFLRKKIDIDLETLKIFQEFLVNTERARNQVMLNRNPQISELFDIYIQNESINCGKLFTIFNQFDNFDEILEFFIQFLSVYEGENRNDEFVSWTYQIFCKYISQILLIRELDVYSKISVRFDFKEIIKNILFLVNKSYSKENQCSYCQYPCPLLSDARPIFLEIITSLIDFNFECDRYYCTELCEKNPIAFLYFLRKFKTFLPKTYLKYCLQIDDCDLIKSFTFDIIDWDILVCYYFELMDGKCLGCHTNLSRKIKNITWDFLGICMLKDLGTYNSIKILINHSKKIPTGSFTLVFYNQCLNATNLK